MVEGVVSNAFGTSRIKGSNWQTVHPKDNKHIDCVTALATARPYTPPHTPLPLGVLAPWIQQLFGTASLVHSTSFFSDRVEVKRL